MTKLMLFTILFHLIIQLKNAQHTSRPNLKFIERNFIVRPTTVKTDYSLQAKDPDSFWMGKKRF